MADNIVLTIVVACLIMMISAVIATIIVMPFKGSLIRLRANYNPRAVGFDGSDNTVGPRLTSLIGTMKRTYRLEGWYGLYKGAFPMLGFTMVVSILAVIFVGASAVRGPKGTYTIPKNGGVGMALFGMVLIVVTLPMTIVINRAIITPYRLPLNARESLRILLSDHERSSPLALFLTPGLLAVVALKSVATAIIAGMLRLALVGNEKKIEKIPIWGLIAFVLFQIVSVAWLCPLEVIMTKLSVQPNLGSEISVEDPEGDVPEGLRFAGQGEDVVGLRPTTDPYVGLVDAVRKIMDEEGWQALYRGWIWTMLGAVFASH
ncbi:hypothetical protein CcaverHIS002_0605520 [Cutaneotrichosporon cavernicola]|uniref:Mitochondrial carrier n=1 Tax=Cutaneotrichosporon cavernicola TaxID=279322 RepID=A0AA48QY67_9TREE|nr:uncharacterized protein CcaverHIS019_0604970 [Cutaneotrichosporon cavernicola]BEI86265.1 hypothetical protein CcaverHIS002_0605520 [Cutaneotrichosporon cavernicola]BEI94038.1 hypothetical protein CcaverHIS019_0604970 [Cutaneotrichosporon cavernicola]BEJ01817.1 hypothetical protein CcaverHIS631_0604990 [Cutaneotrichosporon cavernicola]BEJ09583.1 hypothetical protein CcaverHIS641_0604980 [Cutaneotrichosporon cavernicola]